MNGSDEKLVQFSQENIMTRIFIEPLVNQHNNRSRNHHKKRVGGIIIKVGSKYMERALSHGLKPKTKNFGGNSIPNHLMATHKEKDSF
jgi:hypothetical protein